MSEDGEEIKIEFNVDELPQLSKEELERIRKDYYDKFVGVKNAGYKFIFYDINGEAHFI